MAAGLAGAEAGVRPRLAAGRRREDVEVEAHRHRAAPDHRHLRVGRVPLLLPARDLVRAGRLVQLGGPVRPLPGRARQRFRQPRLARHRDGRRATLDGARAGTGGVHAMPTSTSSRRSPDAAADADAAIERLAIHEAIAAIWTIVDELNGYITEQEPWVLAKDPANARAPLDGALHGSRGAARARGAAQPGDAEGHREALDRARRRGQPRALTGAADPRRRRLGAAARRQHDRAARGALPADRSRPRRGGRER